MRKSNPLFVDSTKFQGDLILTRLQVRAPSIAPSSQFLVEVIRSNGETSLVVLVCDEDEPVWRGQIHLEHLELIDAQVILKTASQLEVRGPAYQARGSHVLDFEWEFTAGSLPNAPASYFQALPAPTDSHPSHSPHSDATHV